MLKKYTQNLIKSVPVYLVIQVLILAWLFMVSRTLDIKRLPAAMRIATRFWAQVINTQLWVNACHPFLLLSLEPLALDSLRMTLFLDLSQSNLRIKGVCDCMVLADSLWLGQGCESLPSLQGATGQQKILCGKKTVFPRGVYFSMFLFWKEAPRMGSQVQMGHRKGEGEG